MRPADGWLVRLPAADVEALIALRLVVGAEVCIDETWAWLRGPRWDDDVARLVMRIPGLIRWQGRPGGPATVMGRQLPSGRVPDSGWGSLRGTLPLTAPRAALPAQVGRRIAPRLVRSLDEHPCDLARCVWSDFAAWVEQAPEHRLLRLRFAADATGMVLLRGDLLPPVPGEHHWRLGPLVLPAGWTLDPVMDAADAAALVKADVSGVADVVLVSEAGWQLIAATAWSVASRSAVRLTGAPHADP